MFVVDTATLRTQSLSRVERAELWRAADTLRGHMDAAEYKHVVLGVIFLKYLSDAFDEYHGELVAQEAEGVDPEDRDEYVAVGLFWVPKDGRWSVLAEGPGDRSGVWQAGRRRDGSRW